MLFDFDKFADHTALITHDTSYTYRELGSMAKTFADAVRPHRLLFLFCTNTVEAVVAYTACIHTRVVPVMVDDGIGDVLKERLLACYQPAYLWLPADKQMKYAEYHAVFTQGGYVLVEREGQDVPLHEDLALLMTTSGSTGSPKLVRQSYRNLRANTEAIIDYLHLTAADRAITNLPMHYVYGLSIINTHLAVGASIVLTEEGVTQRGFWDLFRTHHVTNLNGVPYTYTMLDRLRFARMTLSSLRLLTQAGGKLDPDLHRTFADYAASSGISFVVMYGAAEATARMGYLPAELASKKCGAMGRAIPSGRFELIDEAGLPINEVGQVGELIYHGANVSMGYALSGADLIEGDAWHGRLATGDLAMCDADGIYTVVGRKKRFLKLFGKRTNLQEAEQLLHHRFDGMEVACAGVDDLLHVFVVQEEHFDEIVPFLSRTLGVHPTAIRVVRVPEIPKNAAGKTLYRELERYYDL